MSLIEVKVPAIGDYADVPIVEILVKAGDSVRAEDPLITLESDKATMEVPAPVAGTVAEIVVGVGDKVSEGSIILKLHADGAGAAPADKTPRPGPSATEPVAPASAPPPAEASESAGGNTLPVPADFGDVYASPSVRRLARELDIDLSAIKGTG